jgi:hypothetical protein
MVGRECACMRRLERGKEREKEELSARRGEGVFFAALRKGPHAVGVWVGRDCVDEGLAKRPARRWRTICGRRKSARQEGERRRKDEPC